MKYINIIHTVRQEHRTKLGLTTKLLHFKFFLFSLLWCTITDKKIVNFILKQNYCLIIKSISCKQYFLFVLKQYFLLQKKYYIPIWKPWLIALFMDHAPIPRTMAYMQKFRSRSKEATGCIRCSAIFFVSPQTRQIQNYVNFC